MLVEVPYEADADGFMVVSIGMCANAVARPPFIHFALLVDNVMVANAGPAFVKVPLVNVVDVVVR